MLTSLLAPSRRASLANPADWLLESWGALAKTASGVDVTPSSSLAYPAVLAATRVLAESVAGLPCLLYERLERGKQRAGGHYLYRLLHEAPNPEQTAFEFIETMMGHLVLWGNAYAEIEWSRGGQVLGLWPLRPDMMAVHRVAGELRYEYRLADGQTAPLASWQVLHVRGLGSNGIVGYSPITLARQAIGLGLAAEEFGARFFGNNAQPGMVLEHPGHLTDEAHTRLRTSWEERHQGLAQAHRVAILEEGMKIEQIGIPPEDAQFLETRKFQVMEIARIFRIPPHMLGDLERATFSNIEHQGIEFVVHSLRPWLVRWERRLSLVLLAQEERQRFFFEFLVDALLRGDTESRYRAYATGRQWGWLSANDVRELENLNPLADGDGYLTPLNMVVWGQGSGVRGQEAGVRRQEAGVRRQEAGVRRQEAGGRGQRSAAGGRARHRLAETFRPALKDVAQRAYNRAVNDLGNGARRLLGRRGAPEFETWLTQEFAPEFTGFMGRYLLPIMQTYAELVVQQIADERGQTPDEAEVLRFVQSYVESRAGVHTGRLLARLRAVIREALEEGEDPLAAVEGALAAVKEQAPEELADDEAFRFGNGVARLALGLVGASALVWMAFGDSCPYCQALDGTTVGIEQWFLDADAEFQPEGAENVFRPGSNVGHPPLHHGCDCMVTG